MSLFTTRCLVIAPAVLAGAALALSCGDKKEDAMVQALLAPATTPPGFEEGIVSLTGRVTLKGTPAQVTAVLPTGGDPYCRSHGDIPNEEWKISSDQGLADAFIEIVDAPPTARTAATPEPAVDQQGCRYVPHVVALARGQELAVSNSDQTFHNVRMVRHEKGTKERGRNLANYSQPQKGDRLRHQFTEAGLYRLECDVHRWMRCWVHVAGANHFAVSGPDGRFQIARGLRDGTYTVQAWHHQFAGPLVRSIQVTGGRATADFEFDAASAMN